MPYNILVINPGSTSDDIGYYRGSEAVFDIKINYTPAELAPFENENAAETAPLKKKMILAMLAEHNVPLKEINAVIGRGGLLKPMKGGAYYVNDKMLQDLRQGIQGMHASNLGGILAHSIAQDAGSISLISDAVVVDELSSLARYTGMPDLPRISIFHALNQKRVAFLTAQQLGKPYEKCRFVVLHAGGGASVGTHINGRVVDVNNALEGEGPMTPQRTGTLPTGPLARLCYSSKFTWPEMYLKIKGRGGVYSYTGTHDLRELSRFIDIGEKAPNSTIYCSREKAKEVRDAMIYQFVKYIGYMAAAAEGNLDAIILTGGLMCNEYIRETLKPKIAWLAPKVFVYPGSDEKAALREAAERALQKPETIKEYK
ncbi:MAG: butyrate kinase [Syntrophomonadaceae bacterium]|jgi:butyrate kinase|nr:butyrate kinase [Syntrophomonadaceae bacterium]